MHQNNSEGFKHLDLLAFFIASLLKHWHFFPQESRFPAGQEFGSEAKKPANGGGGGQLSCDMKQMLLDSCPEGCTGWPQVSLAALGFYDSALLLPGLQSNTGPWPVGNCAVQAAGKRVKLHLHMHRI